MHLRNVLLIFTLMVTSILQAEIRVHTRFEPPRVAVGSASKYIVEIVETDNSIKPVVEPVTTLPIPPLADSTCVMAGPPAVNRPRSSMGHGAIIVHNN
jgi:hypothetical protein